MQDGSEQDRISGAVAGGRGKSIQGTGPFHATQHISRPHHVSTPPPPSRHYLAHALFLVCDAC